MGDQDGWADADLVYAFFKFAWSYRLFNYVAIMIGGTPPAYGTDTAEAKTTRCARRGCSSRLGGISIAASAAFSSRSAIFAGSSACGC